MRAFKVVSRRSWALGAGTLLAMLVLAPMANANPVTVRINFIGSGFSGYADLTLGTDSHASSSYPTPTPPPLPGGPGSSPPAGAVSLPASTLRVDPPGAQSITDASGRLTIGGVGSAAITGVLLPASAQTAPSAGEYVPASMSRLHPTNYGAVTYDDLFYSGGSPLTCLWYFGSGNPTRAKYPFSGGVLDPYGVMFKLEDGTFLDLWSNGYGIAGPPAQGGGPGPLNYGAILLSQDETGAFSEVGVQFSGVMASVPEPNYLWLLGAALVGMLGWRRWRETRRAP